MKLDFKRVFSILGFNTVVALMLVVGSTISIYWREQHGCGYVQHNNDDVPEDRKEVIMITCLTMGRQNSGN